MLTKRQYNSAKKRLAIYAAWAEQFKQSNGWTVIPANANPPVTVTNEERSAIEVYEWMTNHPKDYFLYISEKDSYGVRKATTWTGELLGYVSIYSGRVYRSNFGDKRQRVRINGTNGKTYHGIYYCGAGDYARVKQVKEC